LTGDVPVFDYSFTVNAPFQAVSDFHADASAIKTLTPTYAQIHSMDPLGEGSITKFTVWAGPLPIHWTAKHSNVSESGFTDTQIEGPMASWVHTHRYQPIDEATTKVAEHIEYEFGSGKDKLIGLLAFSKPGLIGLFTYRKLVTRFSLRKKKLRKS
jgi:ligand-binding SRPBCC domain-containing protein